MPELVSPTQVRETRLNRSHARNEKQRSMGTSYCQLCLLDYLYLAPARASRRPVFRNRTNLN
jgi:hypothetical protein